MIVNVYKEKSDFCRELTETYIGGLGYINHKEKYFNYSFSGNSFMTIPFDRIDCDNTHQIYTLYQTEVKE